MILLPLLFYKSVVSTTEADVVLSGLGEGAQRLPVPSCVSCRKKVSCEGGREKETITNILNQGMCAVRTTEGEE